MKLADSEATGTIHNTDPMPKAWMARFGRTVGSQVVEALGQRLDGGRGSHVTVGGLDVTAMSAGAAAWRAPEDEADDPFGLAAGPPAAKGGPTVCIHPTSSGGIARERCSCGQSVS